MSTYPGGVAAAQDVLVAVVGWREQVIPGTSTSRYRETKALIDAVDRWLATTVSDQEQGPNIDDDAVYGAVSDGALPCPSEPARP